MYKLGIDLGGTNIAVGVVDENYKIIGRANVKTNLPRAAEEIADDMAKAALLAIENASLQPCDIDSCGVGSPGAVDFENGTVAYSCNLQFYNVNLAKMLNERLNMPVFIENDANAAAYGEYVAGVGANTKDFIAITLGTGVGGGIIVGGKIYSGFNKAGGELGHMVININGKACNCGRKGCYESYASVTALIEQTKASMLENKDSLMWKECGDDIEKVSGKTAFAAMKKGDKSADDTVKQYTEYISVGVANIINIFQPEVLCVGGGISKEGDTLLNPIREFVSREDYARDMKKRTKIVAATLGNDAGIIGAAYLSQLH